MSKVLLEINVACNCGSTGRIAEQIGQKAIESGWEAHIAHSARYARESKLKKYQLQNKVGDYFHYVFISLLLGRSGLGSVLSTRRFLKYLDEIKPDIVHLHNIHGHYINFEILLTYLAHHEIPVIWTMHDCWPITGHCTYFDKIDCKKWKNECGSCQLKSDFPRSLFFDTSRELFNLKKHQIGSIGNLTFVPVSQWLGDIVRNSAIGAEKNIKVIHNGVDTNVFKPCGNSNDEIYRVLGVAAGFGGRKGLKDFIKLRELLPQDFEIIMVGVSDNDISQLPNGIRYIKRTENAEQLAEYYSNADVFINPTYSDNFPTTNIEALACGTPVITYNTGGSPEAVDENTGAVVEQGNIEELCSRILEFKSIGFKKLHSAECRKRAEECFDKDKCFEKYIELYNKVLETQRGGVILCKPSFYTCGTALAFNYGRAAA